jgi:hypothetical protein
MQKATKKNTSIISELYAETTSEQAMIFAIQAHNHIQAPEKREVMHILTSYHEDYIHSIMHAAVYGFRTIHKKRVIFLVPSAEDAIQIQNPQKFSSIARSYKAAVHKSPYHISQSNRTHNGIAKHVQYISLLTDIQEISIIHIPTTQIFQETTHSYLQSLVDEETVLIYCSNIDLQEENQAHDVLMYKLREHMTQDTPIQQLQYKPATTYTIHATSNYIHIGA